MGHSNPSQKGGAFERKCAKELSLWLTHGKSNNQLIRSVSSGGWKYKNDAQIGDLAPNGPAGMLFRGIFGIEAKARQAFEWKHIFTSTKPELGAWWAKHAAECEGAEDAPLGRLIPMIIWKRNYQPVLVGLPWYIEFTTGFPIVEVKWENNTKYPRMKLTPLEVITRRDPAFFLDSVVRQMGGDLRSLASEMGLQVDNIF